MNKVTPTSSNSKEKQINNKSKYRQFKSRNSAFLHSEELKKSIEALGEAT